MNYIFLTIYSHLKHFTEIPKQMNITAPINPTGSKTFSLYFPMLIFSGTTLPFEVMPAAMQKIISMFPLTQGIQLMKATFLGLPIENVLLPVGFMGAVIFIVLGFL